MILPAVIIAGMVVGLGLTLILSQFVPTHPRLTDVINTTAPRVALNTAPAPASASTSAEGNRLGAWAEAHLGRLPFLSTPYGDLDIIGMSGREFWGQKILGLIGGFAMPQMATVVTLIVGVPIPVALPGLVGVVLGLVLFLYPDRDVARKAAEAREEFAAAVVAYIRLVAIRRLSRGGVTTSLTGAARVSDAWMFQRIREELLLAEWSGTTPWSALERLSRQLKVPELGEVADVMSLTEAGAAIAGSLTARASSMRDRQLTRDLRAANNRNSQLVVPQALLVLVFATTLIIPPIVNLLGS